MLRKYFINDPMSVGYYLFEIVGAEKRRRKIKILIPNGFAMTRHPRTVPPAPGRPYSRPSNITNSCPPRAGQARKVRRYPSSPDGMTA